MKMVEAITDTNFDEKISEGVSLVDFWATWCGPCRMQSPIIEELSNEDDGTVNYYTVDVDANQASAQKYSVMSIPTLIVMKDGQAVETLIGLHGKEQLEEIIAKHK